MSEAGMQQDGLGHPCLFLKRRRYYIAFMACLGYVVSYSTRVNLSVAILYLTETHNVTGSNGTITHRKEFNWSEETQNLLLASFFYGYLFTQIPGGYLAGQIGGNHVLNIGVAGSGLVSFAGPFCVKFNVPATVAMRVVCGLFQGITVPAVSSIWARWAPPLERTILSTIAISGNFFSSIIIMPVCSAIGDDLGWEWTFYIFGAVSLVWSIVWAFTVYAGPDIDKFIKESERVYIEQSIGEKTGGKLMHPWKRIFSSWPVGAAVVSQTGHNWGYYTVLLLGPKYYRHTLNYSVQLASIFTGVSFTITGFLMVVFGQISDRMRRGGMKTVTVRKLFCCGGFLIQITFMLLLAFIKNRECAVAFSILAIGLGGITWSAFNVNPLDIAAPHASIISGIANTSATFSGIFCPLVAALFIPQFTKPIAQDWMWVWIITAGALKMNDTRFDLWSSEWSSDFPGNDRGRISLFLCSSKYFESFDWAFWMQWTAAAAFASFVFYYYLVQPMNLKRDLTDVGFDYLTDGYYKSARHRKKNKRELVQEVQRLRKVGDLPPAYPNGWFPLMESDDLKKNEVKDIAALGEHFAVFRNSEGKVQILDAYCPHLGANMAIGGSVHGNCLECPFHCWRFDGDTGLCVSIPYAEKVPGFIKVKKWHCVEVNSLIFVWYHAENVEPYWYPQDLEAIKSKKWPCHGRSEFLIACHIQDISENGGDIAHLNAIHSPNLFGGHDLRFCERFYLKFMRHIWRGEWHPNPKECHKGHMSLSLDTRLLNKFSLGKMDVQVEQVGPAYAELQVESSWGPMVILQAVTPIEPLQQKVVNRIYAPYKNFITARLMLYGELIMFERDIMVWNHKKFLSKPQLVKEEKALSRHRRWYSQFYSEHSSKVTFRKETLDW